MDSFETIFSIFCLSYVSAYSSLVLFYRNPHIRSIFGLFLISWVIWLRLKYSWIVNKALIPVEIADIL